MDQSLNQQHSSPVWILSFSNDCDMAVVHVPVSGARWSRREHQTDFLSSQPGRTVLLVFADKPLPIVHFFTWLRPASILRQLCFSLATIDGGIFCISGGQMSPESFPVPFPQHSHLQYKYVSSQNSVRLRALGLNIPFIITTIEAAKVRAS
jgi:hypothetical protein